MTIWHSRYRFAEHSAAVLQLRQVWNTGYVIAVDHTGSPFKIPTSKWKELQVATEDDFFAAAKMAEIAAGTMVNKGFGDPSHNTRTVI